MNTPSTMQLTTFADRMGRKLAQAEVLEGVDKVSMAMRDELTKIAAFNPAAMGIGAGIGALGGAVSGMQRDAQGQRHILRNAAGGAALGAAGGAAVGHMAPPKVAVPPVRAPSQLTSIHPSGGTGVPPQPKMPTVDYEKIEHNVGLANKDRMASLSPEAHAYLDNHPTVRAGVPKEVALQLIHMSSPKGTDLNHAVRTMAGPKEVADRLRAVSSAATVATPTPMGKVADVQDFMPDPEVFRAALKATTVMTAGGAIGYAGGKLLGRGIGALIKKKTGLPPEKIPNLAPYLAAGTALLGGALMAAQSERDKQLKGVLRDAYQRSEKQRRPGNVGK
jgi:hypothetical protein